PPPPLSPFPTRRSSDLSGPAPSCRPSSIPAAVPPSGMFCSLHLQQARVTQDLPQTILRWCRQRRQRQADTPVDQAHFVKRPFHRDRKSTRLNSSHVKIS